MKSKQSASAGTRALLAGLALACASLSAAAQTTASVQLANVKVQVVDLTPDDGIWPWVWVVNNVDWAPQASSTVAQIGAAGTPRESHGWLGTPLTAALGSAHASASASTGSTDFSAPDGAWASASAQATGGASSWSVAQLFSGHFFAGAGTQVVVTADVQSLEVVAAHGSSMALASLGISNADGSAFDSGQAWSFDGPDFIDASTPSTLTVRWDNLSDAAQTGQLWVTVSAQALSAVPEPGGMSMMALAALAGAAIRRRMPLASRT